MSPTSLNSRLGVIALGPDGTPHVVWHGDEDGNSHIFYSRAITNSVWLTPTNLSESQIVGRAPDVAIDQEGKIHVTWQAYPDTDDLAIYYRVHNDDGWSPIERLSLPQHRSNFSQITTDPSGRPHVVWYDVGEQEIYYTYRTEGTWTTPINVSNTTATIPQATFLSQSPNIAIDSLGWTHIAWFENVDRSMLNSVYYATNKDGQLTSDVVMSLPDNLRDMLKGAGTGLQILAGASDSVHLLWQDVYASDQLTVYHSRKIDSDWTSPTVLLENYQNAQRPSGYLDESAKLHMVWRDLHEINQVFTNMSTDLIG